MGGSFSKKASQSLRKAGQSSARKYPSRVPPTSSGVDPAKEGRRAGRNDEAAEPETVEHERSAGQRSPPSLAQTPRQKEQASGFRSPAINLDARDPDLASNLSRLGPVQPNPTYSPSSTTAYAAPRAEHNPILGTLAARQCFAAKAEQEASDFAKADFPGKTLLDVRTLRKALVLRDEQGMPEQEIERALSLKKGVMKTLGNKGVVEAA